MPPRRPFREFGNLPDIDATERWEARRRGIPSRSAGRIMRACGHQLAAGRRHLEAARKADPVWKTGSASRAP